MPLPLPNFSTKLTFVDKEGEEVNLKDLGPFDDPLTALEMWERGDIRRTIKVTTHENESKKYFREYLRNIFISPTSDEFRLFGEHINEELRNYVDQLSLAHHIFHLTELQEGESPAILLEERTDSPKWTFRAPVAIDAECEGTVEPTAIKTTTLYPAAYPVEFSVIRSPLEDFTGSFDPEQFTEELLLELVNYVVKKDNDTTFMLLEQAAESIGNQTAYKSFTPTALANTRNRIWEYQLAVPTLVTSLSTLLTNIDTEELLPQWYSPIEKVSQLLQGAVGKVADVEVLCTGSEHDPLKIGMTNALYMCAPPRQLGARLTSLPLSSHPIDKRPFGQAHAGYFFYGRYATAVVNSNAVSQASFV